jgi:hypothetical protein
VPKVCDCANLPEAMPGNYLTDIAVFAANLDWVVDTPEEWARMAWPDKLE